jgi:hypothetical protein
MVPTLRLTRRWISPAHPRNRQLDYVELADLLPVRQPAEITPQTPKAGDDKEWKKIVGEKAIAPVAEGPRWDGAIYSQIPRSPLVSITSLIRHHFFLSTTYLGSNFDTASGVNYFQRFFWVSIDKKF